jgi:hypothetical protein
MGITSEGVHRAELQNGGTLYWARIYIELHGQKTLLLACVSFTYLMLEMRLRDKGYADEQDQKKWLDMVMQYAEDNTETLLKNPVNYESWCGVNEKAVCYGFLQSIPVNV